MNHTTPLSPKGYLQFLCTQSLFLFLLPHIRYTVVNELHKMSIINMKTVFNS